VLPSQLSSVHPSLPGKVGTPPPPSYMSQGSQFSSLSTASSSISPNQRPINSERETQFQYLLQGIPPVLSPHYELSSNDTRNPMLTRYSQDCVDHSINTGWQKNSQHHSSAPDSTLLHTRVIRSDEEQQTRQSQQGSQEKISKHWDGGSQMPLIDISPNRPQTRNVLTLVGDSTWPPQAGKSPSFPGRHHRPTEDYHHRLDTGPYREVARLPTWSTRTATESQATNSLPVHILDDRKELVVAKCNFAC
jgi:hypothetical protein